MLFTGEQDTICAISSPPGQGAIALIRISGKDALSIASSVIHPLPTGKGQETPEANRTYLAGISDEEGLIDEGLVTFYYAPRSFTGEDMAEISCHGSLYIQQRIMLALTRAGARAAGPGEFTQRAFMNQKLDLAQAEAVADLVAVESSAAHRLALSQLKGNISGKIREMRGRLLDLASLVELELDFSDEDVEFADREQLLSLAHEILGMVKGLAGSFRQGNALKNGIPVAIVGEPNVGKSTLLNALLEEERAIVSEIPGTTRDSIEDTIIINGIQFRFIDTAGLRDSADRIERIGVERTYHKAEHASLILYIAEITDDPDKVQYRFNALREKLNRKDQLLILVVNKTDRVAVDKIPAIESAWRKVFQDIVFISARDETNLERLEQLLLEQSALSPVGEQEIVISNVRHYEALKHTGDALERMTAGIHEGLSNDLLAQDLREALHYLGEITGEITTDDILGNIFSKFCIGK